MMTEARPLANGLPKPTVMTYNGPASEMTEVLNEVQPMTVQPLVKEISNGQHFFLQNMNRKRKRTLNGDSLEADIQNLRNMENGYDGSPASPTTLINSSMVTIIKYQNGEFVEVEKSLPSYNSPMSLRDMRNAITASLESCIDQSNIEPEPSLPRDWSVNVRPQQLPVQAIEPPPDKVEVAPPPKKTPPPPEPPKIKKTAALPGRKIKMPDKESIKFANRQREIMKLKKEMKEKMKMEAKEGIGPSNTLRAEWGRTVGVTCTMCGKHVQKSYGCFRRDTAPEKLMHLFEPGMNRIKICRRCLPYKKQPGSEDAKRVGRKPPEKTPGNDIAKSNPSMNNVPAVSVTKPVDAEDTSHEKPVSTATLDAIQRKLTATSVSSDVVMHTTSSTSQQTAANITASTHIQTSSHQTAANVTVGLNYQTTQQQTAVNVTTGGKFQTTPQQTAGNMTASGIFTAPKIILGETGKGEAMQYIKKLAENLKANYNKDPPTPTIQNKITLGQQHVTSLPTQRVTTFSPVTTSSNPIQGSPASVSPCHGNTKDSSTSQVKWTPVVLNKGSSIVTSLPNIIASVRPSVKQETGSSVMTSQSWTQVPVVIKQQAPKIASSAGMSVPAKPSGTPTTKPVQLPGKAAAVQIPALVVSSQNAVPGAGSVLLQIQRVKLVRERVGESKDIKTKLKVEDDNAGGKSKRVRPVMCMSCKSNVVKSYRCVNQILSPPKLQHLFRNQHEVLRICRKCLCKNGDSPQRKDEKEKDDSLGTLEDSETPASHESENLGDSKDQKASNDSTPCATKDKVKSNKLEFSEVNDEKERDFGTLEDNTVSEGIDGSRIKNLGSTGATEDASRLSKIDTAFDNAGVVAENLGDKEGCVLTQNTPVKPDKVEPLQSSEGLGVNPDNSEPQSTFGVNVIGSLVTVETAGDNNENLVLEGTQFPEDDLDLNVGITKDSGETLASAGQLDKQSPRQEPEAVVSVQRTTAVPDMNTTETETKLKDGLDTGNGANGDGGEEKAHNLRTCEESGGILSCDENISNQKSEMESERSQNRRTETDASESKTNGGEREDEASGLSETVDDQVVGREQCEEESEVGLKTDLEKETALDREKETSAVKLSEIKGNELEANAKSSDKKSLSTQEKNIAKENEKGLRQRKVVARGSPSKSEKKIEPKCHNTRRALLKEKKEAEIVFENKQKEVGVASDCTTQGVKRKNEKRQCRGKKTRLDDGGTRSGGDETTSGKQDLQLTKDVRASPSKRMKTNK